MVLIILYSDNGKLAERQGRKATGLQRSNAMTAGLPKNGYRFNFMTSYFSNHKMNLSLIAKAVMIGFFNANKSQIILKDISTKEVTKFVNDMANPLEQVLAIYDDKDNLQASYVYGNERISVHDMDTTTGAEKELLYYLYDGLGSDFQLIGK